jgi:hypothetical protein
VALLAFFIYRLGAVLVGAFLGALLSSLIFSLFGMAPNWWIYLIGAIPGAILAGVLVKPFIKIASAFEGGYLAMAGLLSLIQGTNLLAMQPNMLLPHLGFPWYFYVGVLVLAVLGMIVQFRTNKGRELAPLKK